MFRSLASDAATKPTGDTSGNQRLPRIYRPDFGFQPRKLWNRKWVPDHHASGQLPSDTASSLLPPLSFFVPRPDQSEIAMTTTTRLKLKRPVTGNRSGGPENRGEHWPRRPSLSPDRPPAGWLRTPPSSAASRGRRARSPCPPPAPRLLLSPPPRPGPPTGNCRWKRRRASRGRPRRRRGSGGSRGAAGGTPGRSPLSGGRRKSRGPSGCSEGHAETPPPVGSQGEGTRRLFRGDETAGDALKPSDKRRLSSVIADYVRSVWMNFRCQHMSRSGFWQVLKYTEVRTFSSRVGSQLTFDSFILYLAGEEKQGRLNTDGTLYILATMGHLLLLLLCFCFFFQCSFKINPACSLETLCVTKQPLINQFVPNWAKSEEFLCCFAQ